MNQLNEMIRILRVQLAFEKDKENPNQERIQIIESDLKELLEEVK